MNDSRFVFYAIWSALLLAPVLGAIAAYAVRRCSGSPVGRWLSVAFGPGLVLLGFASADVSFRHLRIDALVLAVAYLGYCFGTFLLLRRPAMATASSSMGLVLILPIAFGVLLGTLGVLGLGFAVADLVPSRVEQLTANLSYRVTRYGNATTPDGGVRVSVFETWQTSWLERRRRTLVIPDEQVEDVGVQIRANGPVETVTITAHDKTVYSGPIR